MKTKPKHTPGPWKVEDFLFDSGIIVKGESIIAAVGSVAPANDDDAVPLEQALANARLIAASPELKEELIFARRIISNALNLMTIEQKAEWGRLNERDGVDGEGVTRAHERDAVLAKAEGPEAV